MTNEIAQAVAAELARIAAQNPPTDWLKIIGAIGAIITPLGLGIIGLMTSRQNTKSAEREEEAKKRNEELKKAVDGQTDKLIQATSIGQRALGKEEGVKEATAAIEKP